MEFTPISLIKFSPVSPIINSCHSLPHCQLLHTFYTQALTLLCPIPYYHVLYSTILVLNHSPTPNLPASLLLKHYNICKHSSAVYVQVIQVKIILVLKSIANIQSVDCDVITNFSPSSTIIKTIIPNIICSYQNVVVKSVMRQALQ